MPGARLHVTLPHHAPPQPAKSPPSGVIYCHAQASLISNPHVACLLSHHAMGNFECKQLELQQLSHVSAQDRLEFNSSLVVC